MRRVKNQPLVERKRSFLYLGTITSVLYFSEGLPFGIVKDFVPMYLRFKHVDLTSIGLLNIVAFAWTFKFLWSPLIDELGTYRRWIATAVAAITLALAGMVVAQSLGPLFYGLVALLAIASATQDMAVDAFTIRATPQKMLGPVNSIRVMAYRIALMVPGVLGIVASKFGWPHAFGTAAVVGAVVFALALTLPDDRGQASRERPNFIASLQHWLLRPKSGLLLAIAFTYRLGEMAIVAMIKPYWVDRGYSAAEIGTITSIVGVIVSIAAAIVGGALVARFGLYRSLIGVGVMQAVSNIGYAVVATISAGRWAIYVAAVLENIGYGLGTTVFLAFLMSLCDRDRAATEYALLSAAFALTGNIMASASGAIAQHAGYPVYFWLTVLLGLPALLILPYVRDVIPEAPAG
jgi:MFS transporter, PAT family, beta-lactamase induction signal transducer AmpG